MIAVWPLVREQLPQADLWIAGDGSLRPELEALVAARGLGEATRFLGRISDEESNEWLARCRGLAMPSRNEGFGLVYLEAMRRGRPCLVSTLDAGREVVAPPEAGLAADPADTAALAAALVRLLSGGPEWEQWSRQSRARYEAQYTAAHFQRRLLAALAEEPRSAHH